MSRFEEQQRTTFQAHGIWVTEVRATAALAGPVILVQLGLMLTSVVDTAMLGHFSQKALAAGSLGHIYSMGVLSLGLGMLMALDPLVAQAFGARDTASMGRHLRDGVSVSAVLSLVLSIPMLFAGEFFGLLEGDPEVAAQAAAYVQRLIPGNLGFLLFIALRQSLQAMGTLRPMLFAILAGNLVNLAANSWLIFGGLGIPPLGVNGAAWATVIARWTFAGVLLFVAREPLRPLWAAASFRNPRWRRALRTWLVVGTPIALHVALEMWVFTAVGLLVSELGAAQLAGHQIALNLASVSFMVPLGIGAAAAARVGQAVGRQDSSGARRSATVSMVAGMAVMCVSALAFVVMPELLAQLYTGTKADGWRSTVAAAAVLLPIAGAFQIFDGLQVVGAGVLRGVGDTRVPALLALVGFWLIGLPCGAYLAFEEGWGARGLWWGLVLGLASVAILLLLRILRRLRGALQRLETSELEG